MISIKQIKYKRFIIKPLALLGLPLLLTQLVQAQLPGVWGRIPGRMPSSSTRSGGGDTLTFVHRNDAADSITITYRYLDSLKSNYIDGSLQDFNRFYPVPADYVTLGNTGTAAFPVLFTPELKAGWDAGF